VGELWVNPEQTGKESRMNRLVAGLVLGGILAGVSYTYAETEEGERRGPRHHGKRGMGLHMMKELDTDGDGKLSEEEREAAKAAWTAKKEEWHKKTIEKLDTDGDGDISEEECKAAWAAKKQEWHKMMIEKLDADGDGEISEEERKAAREAWGKKLGGCCPKTDIDAIKP